MARQPLLNKRIAITRAEEQSENIASLLRAAGATVIFVPMIRIVPASLTSEDELHVSSFYKYDVVVFPSANSVRNFFPWVMIDKHQTSRPYIIAVGKKTAGTISEFGFSADFVPGKFTSEELMKSLADFDWKTKRVLIPVGNLSSGEIADFVRSKGAVAEQVIVYNTVPNDSLNNQVKSEIRSGQFDLIVLYSPSQVKNFIKIFGADILKGKQIAVIGPTTKKAVEHYGLDVAIMPDNSTTEDLMATLLEHEKV